MTKQEFIESLEKDTLSQEQKIEVCQYFIDNYPVYTQTPFGFNFTALDVRIDGGSDEAVNHAFKQLQSKINKFKEE